MQEDEVIFDLSDLVEFNIVRALHDGSQRKRASLYLVKIRPISGTTLGRKATKIPPVACQQADRLYVLKLVSHQCP